MLISLANIFFPTWFLPVIPSMLWLIMLPANFLIDTLVLYFWCRFRKIPNFKSLWKKSILKIWLFGFLSDLLASVSLILLSGLLDVLPVSSGLNIYIGIGSMLFGLTGALIGLLLIYSFNKKFSFKKCGLSERQTVSAALWLAVITAPWLMMLPTEWLYR